MFCMCHRFLFALIKKRWWMNQQLIRVKIVDLCATSLQPWRARAHRCWSTPGWSPPSSASSCWSVWWATRWSSMWSLNTSRWRPSPTFTSVTAVCVYMCVCHSCLVCFVSKLFPLMFDMSLSMNVGVLSELGYNRHLVSGLLCALHRHTVPTAQLDLWRVHVPPGELPSASEAF